MEYTRRFWRRIGAFTVDAVLANLVVVLVFGWWATSLDSSVRFNDGLIRYRTCDGGGTAFTAPDVPMNKQGWDKVKICNSVSNFVFPSRSITLDKITQNGSGKNTVGVTLPLNSKNIVVVPFPLDHIWFLVWLVTATLFEASWRGATLGKRMFGLRVSNLYDNDATVWQCFLRNLLKLFYLAPIVGYVFYLFSFSDPLQSVVQVGSSQVTFSQNVFNSLLATIAISLINFLVLASVFFPIRKMGRGIYDRLAQTKVVQI